MDPAFERACGFVDAPPCAVHLMGIGGVGMAGLAHLLLARGFAVSGCDAHPNPLIDRLRARGVAVQLGHDMGHLEASTAWVIRSAAVDENEPEWREAGRRGLGRNRRSEALPALLRSWRTIAVSGTHGKTTTTSMLAWMLQGAGLRPGWCIGGEAPGFSEVAQAGGGEWLVAEADESDGRLGLYQPDFALLGNMDFDHMEHFVDAAAFEAQFARLASRTKQTVFAGADDPRARAAARHAPRMQCGGWAEDADYRLEQWTPSGWSQSFWIRHAAGRWGPFTLAMPGRHNAANACLAAAAAFAAGCPPEAMIEALASFRLPRRRLEKVCEDGGVTVYSDYAHHPAEVRALIRSIPREGKGRLLGLFQPHRYTRTRALGAEFPEAFQGLDELILLPVYAASEAPVEGGRSEDLLACFAGRKAPPVYMAASREEGWARLRARAASGDILLIIGAGDVGVVADWARRDGVFPKESRAKEQRTA